MIEHARVNFLVEIRVIKGLFLLLSCLHLLSNLAINKGRVPVDLFNHKLHHLPIILEFIGEHWQGILRLDLSLFEEPITDLDADEWGSGVAHLVTDLLKVGLNDIIRATLEEIHIAEDCLIRH